MKYIHNRTQYKTINEASSERIYDGSWEDTFIGRLFSFMGNKIVSKIKKGSLNKLLNELQRELEKTEAIKELKEEEPVVQKYDVYQNIVLLKTYIKNSNNFSEKEFKYRLENYIEYHKDESNNSNLPDKIRKAHKKVYEGFEEVYKSNPNEQINESNKSIEASSEIVDRFFDSTFQQLLNKGGSVKLSTYNPSVTGYEENKQYIREIISNLISDVKMLDMDEKEKTFIDILQNIPFDDYSSFSKFWMKEVKPLSIEIKKINDKKRSESIGSEIKNKNKKIIDSIISKDNSKIYLKWLNKNGKELQGYSNKSELLSMVDNNKIDPNIWKDIKDSNISVVTITGSAKKTKYHIGFLDPNKIIQIGDIVIDHSEKNTNNDDTYREFVDKKMDEVFTNDEDYKKYMTISNDVLKDLTKSLKVKSENSENNITDPIQILRIFNKAYNSFTITKDEYNSLSNRYSPKVAARKKSKYELIGDSARNKEIFTQWNDGVLQLLQQYSDLINDITKKFIITMLDDNKLFGNRGAQSKLLSELFNIKLDSSISLGVNKSNEREHKIRPTEDKIISFNRVNNIELNNSKIRRVPFVLEVVINDKRKFMTIYPLSVNKGSKSSKIEFKFTIGDDYGFIKNYMKSINVDFDNGSLEEIGMNDSDSTQVFRGRIFSDKFISTNNTYKLSNIKNVITKETEKDVMIDVSKIWMLSGSEDKMPYRLSKVNDEMKKAIKNSKYDNWVEQTEL